MYDGLEQYLLMYDGLEQHLVMYDCLEQHLVMVVFGYGLCMIVWNNVAAIMCHYFPVMLLNNVAAIIFLSSC
jgi:hypothetical protein